MAKEKAPDIMVDGKLQLDNAVPEKGFVRYSRADAGNWEYLIDQGIP